ncbi:hypothetical protein GGI25_000751 [Coemansia spiralis]|uniref:BHLH domain-containing protein n=2 Tax=Coemansia TaxID=4863 RepID=A0A9W8L098_9FUNG|nr:hypothetical protein EDC05_000706 [Coemansia umbellata]KAJ2621959.1 hypothetical protein GGI26_003663 [Coemansia sp. RSA 1358]KAJ2680459.1 hypothetical protein GGI25_000751 [Coemansia spiralis]
MFQSIRYQPQSAAPIAAPLPPRHIYMEHHALRTQQQEHQQKPLISPPLVLPPLIHQDDNKAKHFGYHNSRHSIVPTGNHQHHHQLMASPCSPSGTCYSPGASMASDATVVEYPTAGMAKNTADPKSPSLSYASSKTASPAPLITLAAAAASSSSSSSSAKRASGHSDAGPSTKRAPKQEQPQQPTKRRRAGRGARSTYSAEEKEMRRKISHSAIEKRRRERTNNVLRDLQDMVPWLSKSNKVQKLEILEAAAQYIKELRSSAGSNISNGLHSSPISSSLTHVDEFDDTEEELADECEERGSSQSLYSPMSQSAMKVNFLLS